ncbi:hypothetical protein [Maribacter sp. 2-571]|uniref:hypothetical protein n=1 Tax=Maribacter sp. 2-571 TaxID=3417569 RepID=UPI003D330772
MAEQKRNVFQDMERSLKDVPEEMRGKVMNDVAMAKLAMEMASLFTCNYKSVVGGMFKTNPNIE